MPRTVIAPRFGLPLFWILCWPISEVMAGPIITAVSGSAGQGSGDATGDNRGILTARLLTAVGLEIHEMSLPSREQSSGYRDVFPQGSSGLSSGSGMIEASVRPGATGLSRGAPMPAAVNSSPPAPVAVSTPAQSPDRSAEHPATAVDPVSSAVAGPSVPAPITRGTGSISTTPVSAQPSLSASNDLRAPGTTVPVTAGQATVAQSVGGAANLNTGSSNSGSTISSATSSVPIPQSSAASPATMNSTTVAPVTPQTAGNSTSLPGQNAASPGSGSSSVLNASSLNPASVPSSTSAVVSPAQAPTPASPTTGFGTSLPPAPTTAATLPNPGQTALVAAGTGVSVAGPSGPGSVLSTSGTVNLAPSPGTSPVGPSTSASMNPGASTTGTVTLIAAPGGADGSTSSIVPASPSGAANLITLVGNPQTTSGGTSATGPLGSTVSLLSAAVGGSNGFSSNTAPTVAVVAPAPLSAASALPPVQVSPTVLLASMPQAIGGSPDSLVLPQNTPEPGVIALFAMVSLAAVIKSMASRFRSWAFPLTRRSVGLSSHTDRTSSWKA